MGFGAEVVVLVAAEEVAHVAVLLPVKLNEVEVQSKVSLYILFGIAVDEGVVCAEEGLEAGTVAELLDAHVAVYRP